MIDYINLDNRQLSMKSCPILKYYLAEENISFISLVAKLKTAMHGLYWREKYFIIDSACNS